MSSATLITPDWPAPANVQACATTREGGVSQGAYSALNLGDHVGDNPETVTENRRLLGELAQLPSAPRWLQQVHGTQLAVADEVAVPVAADAVWTANQGIVCAVMTADCLPVLFCAIDGSQVAAAHAGWRGLSAGVLEATVQQFASQGVAAETLLVWLGPAISSANYEVDATVRDAFLAIQPDSVVAFTATRPGHWQLDLYAAARLRLSGVGVERIYGGDYCTFADQRFFSYRREPGCGRQASLIWRD